MAKKPKLDPTVQMVRDLKDGLNSPFWTVLRSVVSDEKESLEAQIFEDENLNDKQRDDLRRWRNFLSYFLDLPEKIIASMEAPKEQVEPDFEVYDSPSNPLKELSKTISQ